MMTMTMQRESQDTDPVPLIPETTVCLVRSAGRVIVIVVGVVISLSAAGRVIMMLISP